MFEPDPADAAIDAAIQDFLDELQDLRDSHLLIVTSWPGQGDSEAHPAPSHIAQQIEESNQWGEDLAFPFIRMANRSEVEAYGLKHGLLSQKLTVYLQHWQNK